MGLRHKPSYDPNAFRYILSSQAVQHPLCISEDSATIEHATAQRRQQYPRERDGGLLSKANNQPKDSLKNVLGPFFQSAEGQRAVAP